MKNINFVIDTVSATTTDHFKVLNQMVWIGNTKALEQPVCRYLNIKPGSYVENVATAETLQVQVVTFTGTTNSIVYAIHISQLNPVTGDYFNRTYSIETPATGTVSATTIATQFRTEINSDPACHITASGSTTLVLTAKTGYAQFTVTSVIAGLGTSIANPSTAGVYPFGLSPYYDLQRVGLTSADYAGSTAGYTKFSFVVDTTAIDNTFSKLAPECVNIFINTDSANAAALIAAIIDCFDASQTVLNDVQLIS